MTGPPLVAGPHAPATSTPPRAPGSVRRTTSIDAVRPDGPGGALVVDARGRDLLTRHDDSNSAEVVDEVALTLRLEAASHALVDTHVDADGRGTVVHEYAVRGFVDARHRRIVELAAEALVLPWVECPAAVAGAERLQGTAFDDVRRRVRDELVGTASCTHLNDTLRSLADLEALLPPRAAW